MADLTELEAFRRQTQTAGRGPGRGFDPDGDRNESSGRNAEKNSRASTPASIWNLKEIIIKHYHNIGFAVDTERGLLVSVVRDVDCKSIFDLAIELKNLAEKTRQGKEPVTTCPGGPLQ